MLQPANTLFVKVSVKAQPYSQNPISIRIASAMHPSFTYNNAQYYAELPLVVTTYDQIYAKINQMQLSANAANTSVDIASKVAKFVNLEVA